ncbi:phospho-sugar mutase [Pseudolysinimonas yzui]|uniref:Phosphomannomutase n=1 Tax=Pseudolysinimonas yzui TaxID=2708254 RepID=A0A8J3GQB8_9MICO|nr:phospho-sugar mutase [Pseudolysinimonas yzui]GHF15153.1 phosphomannomutase [Pseudolysinimonas yzui]
MSLLDDARAWIAQDPDPVTRTELDALVARAEAGEDAATADLAERFSGRLDFGTAGLRGELGAGPMRMNRVLVAQAAAGLAAYLLEREPNPSVVVGYDGRHNSAVFARDSAAILAGAGVQATILPRPLPTPVLAFAVRELRASAGVMVTASHNPARDNGYKVYLGGADGGSQIVSPADGEIAAEIERAATVAFADHPTSTDVHTADESLVDAYISRTAEIASEPAPLRYVYTAMHGVGREVAEKVFAQAGFAAPVVVAAQADPDPDFPTVAFPNPEEPGAMDLAFAAARESGADLVIANDPDADRVAVGVPDADAAGGWRRLTGNEVGWLLGWKAARASRTGTLACSIVSSPALREVARVQGLDFVETLTGFKWISRAPGLIYGYEEALGYLVDPDKVRDKDGISAAVAVLSLFSELRAAGETLESHLDHFALEFGAFASAQISIRVADLDEIPRTMARLRAAPPTEVGGILVEGVDDYLLGVDGFPANDILRLRLAGGGRVIVRPSGTEPKLKCYLDASSAHGSASERRAAAAATVATLEAGMRALLE